MKPTGTSTFLARAALIDALVLAVALAGPLRADIRSEEQTRRLARAESSVWQAVFGQQVLHEAKKQLGKPYVWGAKDGDTGFDCSGLTAYVYGTLGLSLPANAVGQYAQGVSVERPSLLAGDLVFFSGQGSPLHVGIYGGEGQFLHAPGTGKLIQWARLDSPYFRNHYIGARRVSPALDQVRRQRSEASSPSIPPSKESAP